MGSIKILAVGNSIQARNQARGKLFENLMADVLRRLGYVIDSRNTNINFSGIEIEIEGKGIVNNIPLYAECKCYDSDIATPKLSEFFGKYMSRWFKNGQAQGLFVALPGINPHAKGFYQDNIQGNKQISVVLCQEEDVIKLLSEAAIISPPEVIRAKLPPEIGTPGDWTILYTENGYFWVNYIIPHGSGIPGIVSISDKLGEQITDKSTLDFILNIYPELGAFQIASPATDARQKADNINAIDEIVEVRGSSQAFEYQFPASPSHFVGREDDLSQFSTFVTNVISKQTTCRGLLFEANSGWGKSSIILTCVENLRKQGHFAVAIDSRSASTSQFVLRVADYVFNKFQVFSAFLPAETPQRTISGFEGAINALIDAGRYLEKQNKLLIVFLDQFENIFFLEDALMRIRDMILKLSDALTNVVLGFSWKTDLVGLTNDFPYRARDAIISSCKCIALKTFSDSETNAVLQMLEGELQRPLRKDLKFFLSEFSQGYPWLLKKLCAHVKAQREHGVPQLDIATGLLNVESLFREDLQGLTPTEEETLRRLAKSAPVTISELGEQFDSNVVQSLVFRHLVVRIANKYDIYWDIFRDYLNTGRLPIQENYILRTQVTTCISAAKVLRDAQGTIQISNFKQKMGLTDKSYYNVVRDMGLLGLAIVDKPGIIQSRILPGPSGFQPALRAHLKDRLSRNRLVSQILTALQEQPSLTFIQISTILQESCPYISATAETWLTYARIFVGWMDAADLIIWEPTRKEIRLYNPSSEIRERDLFLASRRAPPSAYVLQIQFAPVEEVLNRIIDSLQKAKKIDWEGISKTTRYKTIATLEDFGYLRRNSHTKVYTALPKLHYLISVPQECRNSLRDSALEVDSFKSFLTILNARDTAPMTLPQLATAIQTSLHTKWKHSTATICAKIMLNWARSTGLAPSAFNKPTRRFHPRDTKEYQLRLQLR